MFNLRIYTSKIPISYGADTIFKNGGNFGRNFTLLKAIKFTFYLDSAKDSF